MAMQLETNSFVTPRPVALVTYDHPVAGTTVEQRGSAQPLVPIVDVSAWGGADGATNDEIAAAVDDACRTVGFMQIVGHGIPTAVIDGLAGAVDWFFALPIDEKRRSMSPRPSINRGYTPPRSERLSYSLGVVSPDDLFEAFNVGADVVDRDDPFYANDPHGFFAANVWPPSPAAMRPAVVAYFDEARRVALELTDVFAVALGLTEHWFRPFVDRSTVTMRVIHYERRPDDPPPAPEQMRMGAHTDYGIVTVLHADPVPGLQIVGPDGGWHDVVPLPGALLVNLGDLTAQWTNDRWRSTLHRVVPPPADASGGVLRRSVAFFFDGNYDAVVSCLPTCVSDAQPAKYAPVVAGEHLMEKVLGPRTLRASAATDTAGERLRVVTGSAG